MSKKYVIQWKSKINGRAGRGTKMFDQEEAEQLVAELNAEYPDIHHELIESSLVTPPPGSEPEPVAEPAVAPSEGESAPSRPHAFSAY